MSDQELVGDVSALRAALESCEGIVGVGAGGVGEEECGGGGEKEPGVGSGELGVGSEGGVTASAGAGVRVPEEEGLEPPVGAPAEVLMLRMQQQYALEDLVAGKSYVEAARTAGVNRRTLYRWVNEDPAFGAALEAWRRRTARVAEDRLTQGVEAAAELLTRAAGRDFRAAAILLKGRGMLPGAGRQVKAVERNPLVLAVPPGKRRDFEVRLRELILSFREVAEESGSVGEGVGGGGEVGVNSEE